MQDITNACCRDKDEFKELMLEHTESCRCPSRFVHFRWMESSSRPSVTAGEEIGGGGELVGAKIF